MSPPDSRVSRPANWRLAQTLSIPACRSAVSTHVGEPISADDTQALENLAGYVTRNPLSLQRLVYLDGQQAVIYKGLNHNQTLGRNFETMDPLEWLARMADHIPSRRGSSVPRQR